MGGSTARGFGTGIGGIWSGHRNGVVAVAFLIGLAVVAGVYLGITGGQQPEPSGSFAPAGNGLIAYSYDGDIFVGGPAGGETRPIIAGPDRDLNPIFSPDGTRIAFVRGDPGVEASIVVIRSDGSGERVVVPMSPGPVGPFAWTPDGASLVVEIDSPPDTYPHGDGELSLFDVSGATEPRLLTPPLPATIGAMYFNASAQVAPMFRPPAGDLIVSAGQDAFDLFDAALSHETPIAREFLAEFDHYWVNGPTWSPDGAHIVFGLTEYDAAEAYVGEAGLFVMTAGGDDVRPIGPGFHPQWAPDGSMIAFERWDMESPSPTTRIVLLSLASGSERILESSATELKRGATVSTITFNTGHAWYYEFWSWSPDGRFLLLLQDHRTRPIIVDVETDQAIPLPWEADSGPSWQRIVVE